MRLPYILGHNDSLLCCNRVQAQDSFCEHASDRKITTLTRGLCFSFLLLFPFVFWFIYLVFLRSFQFRVTRWPLPPTDDCSLYSRGPLDPWQEKNKHLQAVNELPSMPSVEGVFKLTDFCHGHPLALSFLPLATTFSPYAPLPAPLHHALPPALQFSPSTCLLHALAALGAALSGSGSEQQRSPSARLMFRISHLMRTKGINWRFRPNETSVKLTGPINGNK